MQYSWKAGAARARAYYVSVRTRGAQLWASRSSVSVKQLRPALPWGAGLLVLLVGASVLVFSRSGSDSTVASVKAGGSASVVAADSAVKPTVAIVPADGAKKVGLSEKVKITATQGTLSAIKVAAKSGKAIKGRLSADGTTWTSKGVLAAATTYVVTVEAAGTAGSTTAESSTFRTVVPNGSGTASFEYSGETVGVGMPVIANLSHSVSAKDRTAVQDAMTVTSTPSVVGAWHWMTSTQVIWRPKTYWPANTKVKVTANLAGVQLAPGVWGSKTKHSGSLSIGSAMISTVDMSKHTMTVRKNGKVLKTIPVTTGKSGLETRTGVKVIMTKETSRVMDSTTTGVGKGSPNYYRIKVYFAMRLTNTGEFLHAAPWSVGSQGHANVSHGCTGMSNYWASWMFNHSKVGDVVIYKHSPHKLEWGNGLTVWNMPFSTWSK